MNSLSSKPFAKKTFYLDLKGYSNEKNLVKDLKLLGGKHEIFLTKMVDFVVSNRIPFKQQLGSPATPLTTLRSISPHLFNDSPLNCVDSPAYTDAQTVEQKPCIMSRGLSLLQKAREKSQNGTSDIIEICKQWNIKVYHIQKVLSWVEKYKSLYYKNYIAEQKYRKLTKETQKTSGIAKKINGPFIKIEDDKCVYRTRCKEFTSWTDIISPSLSRYVNELKKQYKMGSTIRETVRPVLKTINGNQLASHQASFTTQTVSCSPLSTFNVSNSVSICLPNDAEKNFSNSEKKKKEKEVKKKAKRSYCEICRIHFSDIEAHVEKKSHEKFLNNADNYKIVENIISDLPQAKQFLASIEAEEQIAKKARLDCEASEVNDGNKNIKGEENPTEIYSFNSSNCVSASCSSTDENYPHLDIMLDNTDTYKENIENINPPTLLCYETLHSTYTHTVTTAHAFLTNPLQITCNIDDSSYVTKKCLENLNTIKTSSITPLNIIDECLNIPCIESDGIIMNLGNAQPVLYNVTDDSNFPLLISNPNKMTLPTVLPVNEHIIYESSNISDKVIDIYKNITNPVLDCNSNNTQYLFYDANCTPSIEDLDNVDFSQKMVQEDNKAIDYSLTNAKAVELNSSTGVNDLSHSQLTEFAEVNAKLYIEHSIEQENKNVDNEEYVIDYSKTNENKGTGCNLFFIPEMEITQNISISDINSLLSQNANKNADISEENARSENKKKEIMESTNQNEINPHSFTPNITSVSESITSKEISINSSKLVSVDSLEKHSEDNFKDESPSSNTNCQNFELENALNTVSEFSCIKNAANFDEKNDLSQYSQFNENILNDKIIANVEKCTCESALDLSQTTNCTTLDNNLSAVSDSSLDALKAANSKETNSENDKYFKENKNSLCVSPNAVSNLTFCSVKLQNICLSDKDSFANFTMDETTENLHMSKPLVKEEDAALNLSNIMYDANKFNHLYDSNKVIINPFQSDICLNVSEGQNHPNTTDEVLSENNTEIASDIWESEETFLVLDEIGNDDSECIISSQNNVDANSFIKNYYNKDVCPKDIGKTSMPSQLSAEILLSSNEVQNSFQNPGIVDTKPPSRLFISTESNETTFGEQNSSVSCKNSNQNNDNNNNTLTSEVSDQIDFSFSSEEDNCWTSIQDEVQTLCKTLV